jgi:CBS domain-containing protein
MMVETTAVRLGQRAPCVTTLTPAHVALEVMEAEGLDALAVVRQDGLECLGVILHRALRLGCVGMRHDPDVCVVDNHLKRDVAVITLQESVDALSAPAATCPVVVIDAIGRPLRVILPR